MDKFDLGVIERDGKFLVVCYSDGYTYPDPFDTPEQANLHIASISENIIKYFN